MDTHTRLILQLLGLWLMLDGAISIIIYLPQSLKEHAIRVIRLFIGLYLFILGAT
jgi:hypothetical protein